MMKNIAFVFSLTLAVLQEGRTQAIDTTKQIDALFSQWNNATPGGSILVARNETLLYQKAYGLADLEHFAPNTTETIFECGSVSKQFTAAAILLLAGEGQLALTDNVRKYVPELPVYDAAITVQHLLNHTSGLKDWGSIGALAGWPRTTRVYTQNLALEIICRQKSVNFTPGTEYSYSNSNYTLLVIIVERLSKQSLAAFTTARFFQPLGMSHTKWRNNFREVIPNRAVAYSKKEGVYQQEMPFENIYGHGGLLTTTGDLLRWNTQLEKPSIGGDPFRALRTQRGRLTNGAEINYASGLFIDTFNGWSEINHSGATAAYRAWLAYYPQKKLTVVALSNDGSFSPVDIGKRIATVYLGPPVLKTQNPQFVSLTEAQQKKWIGAYRQKGGFDVFSVDLKNGQLHSNGYTLLAIHADTLYREGQRWIATTPGTLVLQSGSNRTMYEKVAPSDVSSLASLAGDYFSEEAQVTFTVSAQGTELSVHRKPSDFFALKPAFRDGYLSPDNELYEFKRNKSGTIVGFVVSLSRAESVPFVKLQNKK